VDEAVSDVAVVRWPLEAERREELVRARRPRLLLVCPGSPPPLVDDDIEDWVRLPAEPLEVALRARRLHALTASDLFTGSNG
jgi:hypothetical protein